MRQETTYRVDVKSWGTGMLIVVDGATSLIVRADGGLHKFVGKHLSRLRDWLYKIDPDYRITTL